MEDIGGIRMKRLIDVFSKKVMETTESFLINGKNDLKNDKNYVFMQCSVGKARYVYSSYGYNIENFHSDLKLKPELVAIVSGENIYIVDELNLDVWQHKEDALPKNVYYIKDVFAQMIEYAKTVIFTEFYNSLEVEPITETDKLERCNDMARRKLLSLDNTDNSYTAKAYKDLDKIISLQDVANSFCGFCDLDEEIRKRLLERKGHWIACKSLDDIVEQKIQDKSVVEQYELDIIQALREADAKMVNIEFELNGEKAIGKISPATISRCLINFDCFDSWNFDTRKNEKKILEKLGAVDYNYYEKPCLRANNISEITYGKKTLYKKDNNCGQVKKSKTSKDCLSCSNSFSEPCENGDILHCMERDGIVVKENGCCDKWN